MPITPLPSVPSRQDPTNFNDRADAFLGALPAFATEANAQAVEVNTASANAVAANQAVIAATNITKWVSGTTYANGAVVWSPINGLAYRRITASGSDTTDPSLDTTNYKQVNGTGDVSTSGNQTIAGTKTFSNTIVGSITGNAATADAASGSSFVTALSQSEGLIGARRSGYSDVYLFNNDTGWGLYSVSGGTLARYTRSGATYSLCEGQIIVNSSGGQFSTIPGYGGTYDQFQCRAWVNFNGAGSAGANQTIRASGNVSSVFKNATGDYTVNFATSLPDNNYSVTGSFQRNASANDIFFNIYGPSSSPTLSAASVRVTATDAVGNKQDASVGCVSIFR